MNNESNLHRSIEPTSKSGMVKQDRKRKKTESPSQTILTVYGTSPSAHKGTNPKHITRRHTPLPPTPNHPKAITYVFPASKSSHLPDLSLVKTRLAFSLSIIKRKTHISIRALSQGQKNPPNHYEEVALTFIKGYELMQRRARHNDGQNRNFGIDFDLQQRRFMLARLEQKPMQFLSQLADMPHAIAAHAYRIRELHKVWVDAVRADVAVVEEHLL